jgi:hypothetical protein
VVHHPWVVHYPVGMTETRHPLGSKILEQISERAERILEMEYHLEQERVAQAADFKKANVGTTKVEPIPLRTIGAAAGMTHGAVRDAVKLLGPTSARAKAAAAKRRDHLRAGRR